MMQYKLIAFLLLFFLFSCKPKKNDDVTVPNNLMTEEQLINVLTDAYLAEGASGINIKNVTGEKYDSAYIFNPLKEHGIAKTKFDSTMRFYTSNPKKLKTIYDKILEKLSIIQTNGKLN